MGDSGRMEEYESDVRIWRVEEGGEVYWIAAESAWEALRTVEGFADDLADGIGEASVRLLGPREPLTLTYLEEGDIEDTIRDWPRDEQTDPDAGVRVTAYACEIAAALPDLMVSTAWP